MQKHARPRGPWDWRGQLIQIGLLVLLAAVAGAVAYAAATITALATTGEPFPVESGWQNTVTKIVAFGALSIVIFLGAKRINSYLRRTRGRLF